MRASRPQLQLQLRRRPQQQRRIKAASASAPPKGRSTVTAAAPSPSSRAAAATASALRPKHRRGISTITAASSATDSSDADASTTNKSPWWTKNTEGWRSLETAADLARAAHDARTSNRRVLALDLYAPSCSVCKSSWPALSRLARDDALVRDVLFCKASIDEPEVRRVLKEQGITGIPWVLVLDVGTEGPDPPSEGGDEVGGLIRGLATSFLKKQFGGAAAGGGAEASASAPARVLESAGATVVLGQGASFKKINVLRSNLAAVPALVKRGQKVVVDPNGLVVVA
jgi:hypothetical protein